MAKLSKCCNAEVCINMVGDEVCPRCGKTFEEEISEVYVALAGIAKLLVEKEEEIKNLKEKFKVWKLKMKWRDGHKCDFMFTCIVSAQKELDRLRRDANADGFIYKDAR